MPFLAVGVAVSAGVAVSVPVSVAVSVRAAVPFGAGTAAAAAAVAVPSPRLLHQCLGQHWPWHQRYLKRYLKRSPMAAAPSGRGASSTWPYNVMALSYAAAILLVPECSEQSHPGLLVEPGADQTEGWTKCAQWIWTRTARPSLYHCTHASLTFIGACWWPLLVFQGKWLLQASKLSPM